MRRARRAMKRRKARKRRKAGKQMNLCSKIKKNQAKTINSSKR